MKLEVIYSVWGADGDEYAGGTHEIEKPSKKFLRLCAAGEAAGAIKVTASAEERETMRTALESDADSEKKLAKAMSDGSWHEAQLAQHLLDVEQGAPTGSVG